MEDDKTPLQEKLADLADQIGVIGMYSALLTFAALMLHLLWDTFKGAHVLFSMEFLNDLVEYFIIAVSIVVIAVPEGLPLAVTISLAYSVGKMKDEQNLVRYLSACETMGGANNICSDKTGTLTKNTMLVTRLWAQGVELSKFEAQDRSLSENFKYLLANAIALNSDANPTVDRSKFTQVGNKTECALLELIYSLGSDFRELRKSEEIINTVPFSSERKRMSTVCRLKKSSKFYIFTKGAPDILVNYCSKYLDKNNEVSPINEKYRAELEETISKFASQSLRTLLICYQELPKDIASTPDPEKLEKDLIILALAGIKDPLKDAVPEAVKSCKKAGIIVRMVTGDNTETAIAIAKDALIISTDYVRPAKGEPGYYIVMEGKEFRTLVEGLVKKEDEDKEEVRNLQAFKEITDELRVLARSSPEDKYILATGLKQLDNVVAMTGDGTNDAPALKKADIGFAMGKAGTQVAKEASGIILLDDNFSSIITAVKYGRNIFDCIRKFLQFQLTVNLVAISMAFMGAVIIKESPLTPVQILWVNLIMDTLAALALATEPPSNELLNRMPYSRS